MLREAVQNLSAYFKFKSICSAHSECAMWSDLALMLCQCLLPCRWTLCGQAHPDQGEPSRSSSENILTQKEAEGVEHSAAILVLPQRLFETRTVETKEVWCPLSQCWEWLKPGCPLTYSPNTTRFWFVITYGQSTDIGGILLCSSQDFLWLPHEKITAVVSSLMLCWVIYTLCCLCPCPGALAGSAPLFVK